MGQAVSRNNEEIKYIEFDEGIYLKYILRMLRMNNRVQIIRIIFVDDNKETLDSYEESIKE